MCRYGTLIRYKDVGYNDSYQRLTQAVVFWCFLLILKASVTCAGVTLTKINSDKSDMIKELRPEPVWLPFKPILTNAKFTRNGFS